MAESVFLADPDCPTLVEMEQPTKQQKFLAHTARGSRGISFFLLLIEFNLLSIEFNLLLFFLN